MIQYNLTFPTGSFIPLINAAFSEQSTVSLAIDINSGYTGFVSTTCQTPQNVACSNSPIYANGAYNNGT
jgi:hypothetical protein